MEEPEGKDKGGSKVSGGMSGGSGEGQPAVTKGKLHLYSRERKG